jgi:serine/threonine protein kinase
MENNQSGGILLAKGSKSCVLLPSIPCSSGEQVSKTKVSKITYGKNAKESLEHEKSLNSMINSIKGYNRWALTFETFCKPVSYSKLEKYDSKGMKDCLKGESRQIKEQFNKNSQMMIGEYGGITLEKYFTDHFRNVSEKHLEKEFLKCMNMMKPIFLGLVEMAKNKIVHKDIKYNNIVVHKGSFKYIDFGLSSHLKNKDEFKGRAQREFSTSRLYTWYPVEYLFNYQNNNELEKELRNLTTRNVRSGMDIFSEIHLIFNRDYQYIINDAVIKIKNKNVNEDEMLSKMDIYSVGILLPSLFMTKSNIHFPFQNSLMIDEFFQLFEKMSEPYYESRISAEESYKILLSLLKKYSKKRSKRKSSK